MNLLLRQTEIDSLTVIDAPRVFDLSWLTIVSAMSALASDSSRSCWIFRYLGTVMAAISSYNQQKPTIIIIKMKKILIIIIIIIIAHASINAGEAAERAAESKRMKYSTITNTHAFVAVALETGGAWCREGLQLISELGNRIRDATHDPMETSYIFQSISVALQRGNAICISGTLPPLCKEYGGAPKRPVSNGPADAPSAVPLNPPPVT